MRIRSALSLTPGPRLRCTVGGYAGYFRVSQAELHRLINVGLPHVMFGVLAITGLSARFAEDHDGFHLCKIKCGVTWSNDGYLVCCPGPKQVLSVLPGVVLRVLFDCRGFDLQGRLICSVGSSLWACLFTFSRIFQKKIEMQQLDLCPVF